MTVFFHSFTCPSISSPLSSSYCPSGFLAFLPVLGMCAYLFFFAPGLGPLPWTINAEIYPTWARSKANSVATAVNWSSNLFVSLTFLSIIDGLGEKKKNNYFDAVSCQIPSNPF